MKLNNIVLILFAIVLFVLGYYSFNWSKDFVDPCCSGLCGRCPPSAWECMTMNMISMFLVLIGTGLTIIVALNIYINEEVNLRDLLTDYDIKNCRDDAEEILEYIDNMRKEVNITVKRLKELEIKLNKLEYGKKT